MVEIGIERKGGKCQKYYEKKVQESYVSQLKGTTEKEVSDDSQYSKFPEA
jgi:hypothetical protein